MPRPRAVIAASTFLAAVTALAATASPASAADTDPPFFQASASGAVAALAGGAVTSGPTAPTAIRTRKTAVQTTGSAASVALPGLLTTGAVATDSSTHRNTADTLTIVKGHARTAGVNVLGGALTATAIDTTSTVSVAPTKVTASGTTVFTNLKISGQPVINGTVAPNTTIEVPGVLRVVLNAAGSVATATSGTAVATGIIVTVLGGSAINSVVAVNSANAQTKRVGLGYAPLGGYAMGAQVAVTGNSTAGVGPLGAIGMTDSGTDGKDQTNTVASSTLPGVGTTGTLTATANGVAADAASRTTMTASVADVNLLGGLITAKTLRATAQVTVSAGQAPVPTTSVTFTGLTVAGVAVPLDAAPGLVIPLPNVGAVAIRATATTGTEAAAAGLVITLSTAAFGLPAGATIFVGFAYASLLDVT